MTRPCYASAVAEQKRIQWPERLPDEDRARVAAAQERVRAADALVSAARDRTYAARIELQEAREAERVARLAVGQAERDRNNLLAELRRRYPDRGAVRDMAQASGLHRVTVSKLANKGDTADGGE